MSNDKKPNLKGLIKRKEQKKAGEGTRPKRATRHDRKIKGFLIGPEYAAAFDTLKGMTQKQGPELAEEALRLLFEKYEMEFKDLSI